MATVACGSSTALVEQMPATLAALTAGVCSEAHAVRVVEATSCLSSADRSHVDARVGPLLGRLGVKAADRAARRVAAELDAAAVVARMEGGRGFPAGDGASGRRRDGRTFTVLGPMTEVAGAHAALTCARPHGDGRPRTGGATPGARGRGGRAPTRRCASCPGAPGRWAAARGASPGDRPTGRCSAPETLHRSVSEPARIPGLGSLPPPVARWSGSAAELDGADRPGREAARVRLEAALTPRRDGRDLVSMDSRRRVFTGLLRRMLVLRDDLCTTPYCGAADRARRPCHPVPRRGGPTSYTDGNGKCARCNHAKERARLGHPGLVVDRPATHIPWSSGLDAAARRSGPHWAGGTSPTPPSLLGSGE